jgi:transcriptional regulator with XRE-family HTH domain
MSTERKIDWGSLPGDVSAAEDRFLDKCTDIGDQIYELMKERDMSQRDLARTVDKSESYVSRLLAGGVNATMRTVTEFEEALGAEVLVAPMYARREEQPRAPRSFKKKSESQQYLAPSAASYERTARGLEKAGFDMDSCVLPAPNQSSARHTWKQLLPEKSRDVVEPVEENSAEHELNATA